MNLALEYVARKVQESKEGDTGNEWKAQVFGAHVLQEKQMSKREQSKYIRHK